MTEVQTRKLFEVLKTQKEVLKHVRNNLPLNAPSEQTYFNNLLDDLDKSLVGFKEAFEL
ncbi:MULTISPECIES: hypothetical protein [Bizionia]|uniref:hypothetical protein n=1 Tax=Bizionia TaxID=283785 RepID=UPI0012FA74B5|nr:MULTISPECIES: hypothetical protein [Bizionia]